MLKITGMHALKSGKPYDYSHNILETTHHQIRFVDYECDKDNRLSRDEYGRTIHTEPIQFIVSNEELLQALLNSRSTKS